MAGGKSHKRSKSSKDSHHSKKKTKSKNLLSGVGQGTSRAYDAAIKTGATVKYVDLAPVDSALSTTGLVTLVNLMTEGAGPTNRVGRRIIMKSLLVHGFINMTSANGTAINGGILGRIAVVYDRQPTGSLPALSDIFGATNSAGTALTADPTFYGLNLNNRLRFTILADSYVCLPGVGINGATPSSIVMQSSCNSSTNENQNTFVFKRFIKLKGAGAQFKSNGGTLGDFVNGALYMVTLGTDANATAAFRLSFSTRLKFYDPM